MVAVALPFVAFALGVALLWDKAVSWTDLGIMAVMYLPTAFGITIGYHRLFTHRAFEAKPWVKYTFAILGSMAVQGSVIDWVADHRKHHAFTDQEGDPHSPHGHGEGFKGAISGLWYAHMGWLVETQGQATKRKFAPDLLDDPTMKKINNSFIPLTLLGLAIPFALGLIITGTLVGGLTAMLWGGFVRVFFVHRVTWSINSICHFYGRRRFETDDFSTNVFWLAIPSLGESWHHNHHAFPRAAQQGLRWYEFDISAAVIGLLERMGLAWDVVRITPERQQQRLAGAGSGPARRAEIASS
ncbi:fatty acid desaturase [soil metagenome]